MLEEILSQYNEESKNAPVQKTTEFNLANYFSTYLEKGVNEDVKQIRLLPGKDGETPFTTMWLHSKKVDGQFKKFACPKKQKNEDCPFCEAYDLINAEGTEEQKKKSYTYLPRKAYVMRVIDRADEDHGPKFWRVNHSRKKDGLYDSIVSLFKLYKSDLSDPETGRDLAISIVRDDNDYCNVTNIVALDKSPLSSDEAQSYSWINDSKTWENVYSIKSYDFLLLTVQNKKPVWDKDLKKFVDKDTQTEVAQDYTSDLEEELTMGGQEPKPVHANSEPKQETVTPSVNPEPTSTQQPVVDEEDDDDDDLPF